MSNFTIYIRRWRKDRGWTQDQVAEMAGISKSYLSDLELGKRNANPGIASKLAVVLGVTEGRMHELGAEAVGWKL